MLAFDERLVGEMDFKELRSVYNTLQEKELRVHVEIEEEIEEVQRAIESSGSGGGGGKRRRSSLPAVEG